MPTTSASAAATDVDWPQLYRTHVEAISHLARGLDETRLASLVPATPAWTVRQVLAHLAGGAADGLAGRTDGAPGRRWTARHVAERDGAALQDLIAELAHNQDAVAATLVDEPRPGVVWDVAVHHADLHEALGRPRLPASLWSPVLDMVGAWRAPTLLGRVESYELFRGLFSRRSRAQMRAWGTTLSDADLDAVCVFGPREDDQPVPA